MAKVTIEIDIFLDNPVTKKRLKELAQKIVDKGAPYVTGSIVNLLNITIDSED